LGSNDDEGGGDNYVDVHPEAADEDDGGGDGAGAGGGGNDDIDDAETSVAMPWLMLMLMVMAFAMTTIMIMFMKMIMVGRITWVNLPYGASTQCQRSRFWSDAVPGKQADMPGRSRWMPR
jgi:hypothetical protein